MKIKVKKIVREGMDKPRRAIRRLKHKSTPALRHAHKAAKRTIHVSHKTARRTVHVTRKGAKHTSRWALVVHHHTMRRPHLHLMQRSHRYRRYHEWRYHKHVNLSVAALDVLVVMALVLSISAPVFADVTQDWNDFSNGQFTFDGGLEINGTSIRHKAQNYADDANTMGLWHLDELAGSAADDSSSNNNDGTISGGAFGTGNLNNGLTMDGQDDSFSVNDSSSLSLTSSHTLEGWVKSNAAISAGSSTQRQSIIDKGDYQLYIDNETGKLTYELANSSASGWTQVAGGQEGGSWDATGMERVSSVVEIGSNVYAGLGNVVGDAEVWRWNGSSWTLVGGDAINGSWANNAYEQVTSMETDGTNLYAGLGTTSGDGEVWRWNGSTWTKIGGDALNSSWAISLAESVFDLEWYNNKLYAALGQGNADGHVWEWNGTSWTQVAGNGSANSSWSTNLVYSLTSGGGKLYAGLGGTVTAEVWEWSGSGAWTKIAGSAAATNSSWNNTYEGVHSLTYFNSKLYAGLGSTSGDSEVWEFNGTNDWTLIGGDTVNSSWASSGYEQVSSLGYLGTDLYAGLGTGNSEGETWRYSGGAWEKIGDTSLNNIPGSPDIVSALTEGGSTLYAGTADADRGGNLIAWDGTEWDTLGGQNANASWSGFSVGEVEVMHVSGEYLYAGLAGGSDSGGGSQVWRYDGSSWAMIGGQAVNNSWGVNGTRGVYSLTSYNGKLYAGLGNSSGGAAQVWEYDGNSWTKIGGSTSVGGNWSTSYFSVTSMAWHNGKLYAGMNGGSGAGDIMEWSGGDINDWVQVAGADADSWTGERYVNTMAIYNNQLYAGLGNLGSQADVYRYISGDIWEKVGGDTVNSSWDSGYENVLTMVVQGGKLYVGLGSSAGEAEVWEWDGSSWTLVGGDGTNSSWEDGTYEVVRSLVVYNGKLYAGLGDTTGDSEVWRRGTDGNWEKLAGNSHNSSWNNGPETVESFSVYKGKLYAGLGLSGQDTLIWSYGNNAFVQSSTNTWDTNWHHVAATYDGTALRLYIDGDADGTQAGAFSIPDGDLPLVIGTAHGAREQGKPQARFTGQLDEIRISNIARSSFTTTPYASTAQTVMPNSSVFSNGIIGWTAFAESASANGGSINYRLSTNNGTSWMYWSGSAWAISNNISQVSPASTIHANIATLPVVLGGGIKWQAVIQGNGSQRVVLNSVSISASADSTDPATNASSIIMNKSNGGAAVASNGWTNGSTPYFSWTAGTDTESGIYGYCLYLGQTQDSDPQTTKGVLGNSPVSTTGTDCQYITPTANIDLAVTGYLGTPLATSNSPYYLYIKAIDNAGNVFNTSTGFQFRFDNTPPTNPAYLTTPSQFVPSKEVDITWPDEDSESANDGHSGVAGLQYRIGSGGTWYGDSHSGTQDNTDLLADDGLYTTVDPPDFDNLVDGNNTIYFRTWDEAGNVTNAYTTAVLKINTSEAPGSVQNLQATPGTNTLNSFAFDWDPPADGEFLGSVNSLTYCYTFNTEPTDENCTTFTNAGVTSLPAGPYATQPGLNRIYVVAKDEAGNMQVDTKVSANFTANTAAPGIPENLDIADVSIRSTSKWRLALSWDEPSQVGAGVHHYQVYRSTDNNTFGLVDSPSGTSYINTDLSSIKYFYKIRACDSANNCGAYSSVVDDTPTGRFTEAANLTSEPAVNGIGTRRATIRWSTDRESDSRISFGTTPGNYFPTEFANSDQVTDHILEINNLSAGTTYYFVAKWTDEDGNIGVSGEQTFSTAPAPTTKDVESFNVNLSSASIRFSVKGATKAKIYYGKSEGFGGSVEQATSLSESAYSVGLTGLDDGTKYFYKINTFDSDDNEYEGNIFSFTTPARPRISGLRFQPVEGEPTSTQKVTWTTNVPSSSGVVYSTPGQPAKEAVDSNLVTEHEVIIQGLLDDSEYTLTAQSRDGSGNLAASDPQVFRTSLDTRPPRVFDVVVDDSIRGTGSEARGQIIVSWKTDEPSTSQVAYGEGIGGAYTTKTVEDTNLVTDHLVIVSDLPTSRTFHLIAISSDKSDNEGKSGDHTTIIGRASESVIGIIFNALQKVFSF